MRSSWRGSLLPSLLVAGVVFAVRLTVALPPRDAGIQVVEPTWGAVPQEWPAGLELLRRGEPAEALALLARAEARLGVAPPAFLRQRLHAALLGGDLVAAEFTAEKLGLRDGAEDLRQFVVGLAEFARCELAGLQARQPGADPGAFDRAIRHAATAALAFQTASLLHDGGDWPAARRNAERAAARRAGLQRERERMDRERKQEQERPPDESPPDETIAIEPEPLRLDDAGLLSAAELQALLQRLAEAEQEKRGVRRAALSVRSAGVEQDW